MLKEQNVLRYYNKRLLGNCFNRMSDQMKISAPDNYQGFISILLIFQAEPFPHYSIHKLLFIYYLVKLQPICTKMI